MLYEKTWLVTGGTGTLGKGLVTFILDQLKPKKIIILSRDEFKQAEMRDDPYFSNHVSTLRFFLGDVRDQERLAMAITEEVDYVIHTAALKHVPALEYNPFEAVKTNIIGSQNIIQQTIERSVKCVVAVSTDKAAAPINLYGATKLAAEKLFVSANNYSGKSKTRFVVVRYGNVLGSRGSVVERFLKSRESGSISITDERMTRFVITVDKCIELILKAITDAWGGEIFLPKIPSFRINDLADAICPSCKKVLVGIRPGEKLDEELITSAESMNTIETNDGYIILPPTSDRRSPEATTFWSTSEYLDQSNSKPVPKGFSYTSRNNGHFLTVKELEELVRSHFDPNFFPK